MFDDVEDVVDWSDGSIHSSLLQDSAPPIPSTSSSANREVSAGAATQTLPAPSPKAHNQQDEPDHATMTRVSADEKITTSTARSFDCAPHHHHECNIHLSLHQARQNIFESMFLKKFVTQALDPDQLEEHFRDLENIIDIPNYLRTVSTHFNEFVDNFVSNTEETYRSIFTEEEACAALHTAKQLPDNLFSEYGPRNPVPFNGSIQHLLHLHAGPDIAGQGVALDSICRDGTLPPRVARDNLLPPRIDSVHTSPVEPPTQFFRPYQDSTTTVVAAPDFFDNTTHASGAPLCASLLPVHQEVAGTLEAWVHEDSTHAVAVQAGQLAEKQHEPLWKTRLMRYHRSRLNMAQSLPQLGSYQESFDVKSVIAGAVEAGIIKRPAPLVQSEIDDFTSKNARLLSEQNTTSMATKVTSQTTRKRRGRQSGLADDTLSRKISKTKRRRTTIEDEAKRKGQSDKPPRKRLRTTADYRRYNKQQAKDEVTIKSKETTCPSSCTKEDGTSLPPHPSGSTTLELHQTLPPSAYFEPKDEDEIFAWRCGVRHALGYYYIAGNKRACPGCNTNVAESPHTRRMDFYLPSRTHFHQPAPDSSWKPSKMLNRVLKWARSDNSIAKEHYWTGIDRGMSENEAREKAVDALLEYLQSKTKAKRGRKPKPTLEPTPEPEKELQSIDLGPHPSGSTMMEHGQGIPECHYFIKKERHEEPAWRCDINHALGRYYIAGDKRTCPGCGVSMATCGKQQQMDFYLPSGVVVRQEAHGLTNWKPRRKNKRQCPRQGKEAAPTHNQMCSASYWQHYDSGSSHEEALALAIAEVDAYLDAKSDARQNETSGEGIPPSSDQNGETDDESYTSAIEGGSRNVDVVCGSHDLTSKDLRSAINDIPDDSSSDVSTSSSDSE